MRYPFLAIAFALLACAAPPPRAPAAARGPIEELEQELRERPGDGAVMYALAMTNDRAGKVEDALAWLAKLDGTAWDAGVDGADFLHAQAAAKERFGAIRSSLDAKAPRVPSAEDWLHVTERDLLPEGLEVDPTTGDFLVSSGRKRKVVRVARDGTVRDVLTRGQDGLLATLGLRVDGRRGVLWVASAAAPFMEGAGEVPAGTSRLHAFELATGTLRARYELPGPSLLNDVAILPDGRAVVTDSAADGLYVAGAALEPLLPAGTLSGPNGVALAANGALLYVATWRGIVVVDWRSRAAAALALPPGTTNLAGIDGLYVHEGALLGIQNAVGRPRIVRIPLDGTGRRGAGVEVIESGSPIVDNPTTGAVSDGAFVFLARRNRESALLGSSPAAPLEDIVLARVPLR